jgi:hypothetical protein
MGGLRRVQMGGLLCRYWRLLVSFITEAFFLLLGVGLFMGTVMVSSIVMYNFGVGPRGDPLFTAF